MILVNFVHAQDAKLMLNVSNGPSNGRLLLSASLMPSIFLSRTYAVTWADVDSQTTLKVCRSLVPLALKAAELSMIVLHYSAQNSLLFLCLLA